MSIIEAFLLGIVQGITEFFPVSSSGHLKLGELLLGLNNLDQYVTFDLTCHLGTLLAIFCVLYREIWQILLHDRKTFWLIIIATLPLGPLYFVLNQIKAIYGLPQYLGFFFLFTSLLLYLSERFSRVKREAVSRKKAVAEALFIGCAQAIAILPAVSRSGSTMAAARFLGWDRERAARFSFFLAIPTILGGMVVESRHTDGFPLPFGVYLIGLFTSFIVGILFLKLLLLLLKHITFKPFAIYCAFLGLLTLGITFL